jgi:hypothetical protein
MEISDILLYMIMMVFGVGFSALLIHEIASTDMTTWTFTGHEIAAGVLQVFPYIFLMAIIAFPVYHIMRHKV